MKKLLAICLFIAGCNWPFPMAGDLPDPGTCRHFYVTSWTSGWNGNQSSPWSDLDWRNIHVIDEPLLPMWNQRSNLDDAVVTQQLIDELVVTIEDAKRTGKLVWLNWSTDEMKAFAQLGIRMNGLGMNADIISFDSYAGSWAFPNQTDYMLDMMWRELNPGQRMGLVPEGHYCPDCGVRYSENEEALVASMYAEWAFHHNDDRLFAIAPFIWDCGSLETTGCDGLNRRPFVATQYRYYANAFPRCD